MHGVNDGMWAPGCIVQNAQQHQCTGSRASKSARCKTSRADQGSRTSCSDLPAAAPRHARGELQTAAPCSIPHHLPATSQLDWTNIQAKDYETIKGCSSNVQLNRPMTALSQCSSLLKPQKQSCKTTCSCSEDADWRYAVTPVLVMLSKASSCQLCLLAVTILLCTTLWRVCTAYFRSVLFKCCV